MLKKIGLVLGVVIAVLLIAALFVPRLFVYEKSILINAPIDQVWEHTNSLTDLDKWSPWNSYDPDMKKTFEGVDGTRSSKLSWESSVDKVGAGSRTLVKLTPPFELQTELKFYNPYESEAKEYFILESKNENSTLVTWRFTSDMPYPFNLLQLVMNINEAIGKDFEKGLQQLKKLCEPETPQ